MEKFKCRNQVIACVLQGEVASARATVAAEFQKEVKEIIKSYSPRDILKWGSNGSFFGNKVPGKRYFLRVIKLKVGKIDKFRTTGFN